MSLVAIVWGGMMNWKNSEEKCSQEGQVRCRCCYGRKVVRLYSRATIRRKNPYFCHTCLRCGGTGTILWIDEAVGRNRKRRKRQWKKPRGRKK